MNDVLPFELTTYFSANDLARGAERLQLRTILGFVGLGIDLAVLVALTVSPLGRRLWLACTEIRGTSGPLDRLLGPDWRSGALFLSAAALIRCLIAFPLDAYLHAAELRFGLSHESLPSYARRVAVGWAVAVVATAILGAALGAVRKRWPRRWWLAIGGGAALVLVGDAVAEPLWDHFDFKVTSLDAGPIRDRVEHLLKEQRADVGDIVVLDASRYGTKANAFVAGLGPTKRLILTDTLLKMGEETVAGAVAHELGHRRSERLPGRLALAAGAMVLVLWLLDRLLSFAMGRGALSDAHALPYAVAVIALLFSVVSPIRASLNRAHEPKADAVDLSVRRDYDAYVHEQVEIARPNATDPSPPGWVQPFLTHPSPKERIGRALWYKARPSDTNP